MVIALGLITQQWGIFSAMCKQQTNSIVNVLHGPFAHSGKSDLLYNLLRVGMDDLRKMYLLKEERAT